VFNNPVSLVDLDGHHCNDMDRACGIASEDYNDSRLEAMRASIQIYNRPGDRGGLIDLTGKYKITRTVWGTSGCDMRGSLCQLQYSLLTARLAAKVFLQGLARNFVDELKEGGCVREFGEALKNDVTGDPTHDPHADAAISNATRSVAQSAALAYAARKALVVPMRSSVVRGILQAGEKAAPAVSLALTDYSFAKSLLDEMQSMAKGTCR
jgi:hypothetical protein